MYVKLVDVVLQIVIRCL